VLTTHTHLVLKSKMSRSYIPPFPWRQHGGSRIAFSKLITRYYFGILIIQLVFKPCGRVSKYRRFRGTFSPYNQPYSSTRRYNTEDQRQNPHRLENLKHVCKVLVAESFVPVLVSSASSSIHLLVTWFQSL
jgi:hypothetical protein